MQRRQTIGNFSLPPNTPSTEFHGRLSDAGSLLNSSTQFQLNNQPGKQRKTVPGKDPRNVGDKAFTKQCVDKLSRYLESHGYEGDYSRKKISNPSTNDFLQMLTFLQKQYDPQAKPITSPQQEVPPLFQKMRYPYQINSRLLVTVAAPHTWPHLLAAMAYLVDVLNVVEVQMAEGDSGQDWIAQCYQYSMEGQDEAGIQMEEQVNSQFVQQIQNLQQECNQVQQHTAELWNELEPLKNNPSPLEQAQQTKAQKESELQKYQEAIQGNQSVLAKCTEKLQEQERDLDRISGQLALAQEEVEQLEKRVAAQPYSKIQVNQMAADLQKSRDILRSVQEQREMLESQFRDQELQVAAAFEELKANVRNCCQICSSLKLIPASNKRATGVDFELQVNREFKNTEEILNQSVKHLESCLDQVVNRYKSKTWELQQQSLSLKEQAYLGSEALENQKNQNIRTEEVIEQMEAKTREIQKQTEQLVQAGSCEISKLEKEMSEMKEQSQSSLKDSQQNLLQVQEQSQQLENQLSQSLKQQIQRLQNMLTIIPQTRNIVSKQLEETGSMVSQIHKKIKGMDKFVKKS